MWAAEVPFREVQGRLTTLSGHFCLCSSPKQLHLVFYCYSQLIKALLWFEFGQKVPSSYFFLFFLFLVWQWILATYSVSWANINLQYYYIEYSYREPLLLYAHYKLLKPAFLMLMIRCDKKEECEKTSSMHLKEGGRSWGAEEVFYDA